MAVITRTHTKTYNAVIFADPYKKCTFCRQWIDGYLDSDEPGLHPLVPCEHRATYQDICPSWGPVDGCTCLDAFGRVDHNIRRPAAGDDRRY